LIFTDEYQKARKLIQLALKKNPDDHWLLSRLALTYYEQFKYDKAYSIELRALSFAPKCPMVLWGAAGSLHMLGRQNEAILIYKRLVKRGVKSLAFGECGEGIGKARGLIADCLYRLALCYELLGNKVAAAKYYQQHLDQRGPGCHSIYSIREVRKEYRNLRSTC
jgi:tetratricopeptide (TPR) repeat protein